MLPGTYNDFFFQFNFQIFISGLYLEVSLSRGLFSTSKVRMASHANQFLSQKNKRSVVDSQNSHPNNLRLVHPPVQTLLIMSAFMSTPKSHLHPWQDSSKYWPWSSLCSLLSLHSLSTVTAHVSHCLTLEILRRLALGSASFSFISYIPIHISFAQAGSKLTQWPLKAFNLLFVILLLYPLRYLGLDDYASSRL